MERMSGSFRDRQSTSEKGHDDYEGYELIARRMWIILPSSWFRASWDWFLILLVLYNLVSIPIEKCALTSNIVAIQVPVSHGPDLT
jgi:hypothetical protein